MFKKHPAFIAFFILLIASIACSQSAPAPAPDPNALNTSIAQTVAARQTEEALKHPPTATSTFTAEPPTLTFTPILSATPDFTATSATPMITVSKETNCRTGPGAVYQRVGVLLVGETAEVVGRDNKGEFWYIRNPDEGAEYCWLWGEYATLTGNIYTLLLYTPAPLPVSSFSASFKEVGRCTADSKWWADFELENLSDGLFRSISIKMTDVETVTVRTLTANVFTVNDGCNAPVTTEVLVGAGLVKVSSPVFPYALKGHNMNAKITVCTKVDQTGTCVTQEINFKPE